MSIRYDIKTDFKEAEAMYRSLLGRGVDRAVSRALNKTATSVRAQVARDIQQERALKIGTIKKSLRLDRANVNRLAAAIVASGKAIAMRHFGARSTRQGVSVKIRKTGGRTRLVKNGNKSFQIPRFGNNVFVRTGKSRLPIKEWSRVPGIPQVFLKDKVTAGMRSLAGTVWPKRFREEINFEIEKAKAKARAR